jgi:hypothetical protein
MVGWGRSRRWPALSVIHSGYLERTGLTLRPSVFSPPVEENPRGAFPSRRAEQQAVAERFLAALRTGQLADLMAVLTAALAPDVVLIADGGGIAAAVLAPVRGAERVAALLGRASRTEPGFTAAAVWLNAAPAATLEVEGEPAARSLAVADGRVTRVYLVRNPPDGTSRAHPVTRPPRQGAKRGVIPSSRTPRKRSAWAGLPARATPVTRARSSAISRSRRACCAAPVRATSSASRPPVPRSRPMAWTWSGSATACWSSTGPSPGRCGRASGGRARR